MIVTLSCTKTQNIKMNTQLDEDFKLLKEFMLNHNDGFYINMLEISHRDSLPFVLKLNDIRNNLSDHLYYRILSAPKLYRWVIKKLASTGPAAQFCSEDFHTNDLKSDRIEPKFPIRFEDFSIVAEPFNEEDPVNIGRLVRVVGDVSIIKPPIIRIKQAAYQCLICSQLSSMSIHGTRFRFNRRCTNKNCPTKGGAPSVLVDDSSIFVTEQEVHVTGLGKSTNIIAILTDDLIDFCKIGQRISLLGEVTVKEHTGFFMGPKTFKRVIKADSILLDRNSNPSMSTSLTPLRFERSSLISCMAPHLCGLEDIKLSLLLAYVSRWENRSRAAIHILLVGDPSVGKSQLLRFMLSLDTHAVCTSGRGSSAVGLTASVQVGEDGNTWFSPGALVQADGTLCCIDEFEKMTKQNQTALHEAMEQGVVSLAKYGCVSRFSSKATILAACNPIGGSCSAEPLENFGLTDSLISRFDLIWVMKGSEFTDKFLQSITAVYRGIPIYELNPDFHRHVNACRQMNEPAFDPRFNDKIVNYYLETKEFSKGLRITPRILYALIRMAKAFAKLRGSDMTNETDVNDAISLHRSSRQTVKEYFDRGPTKKSLLQVIYDIFSARGTKTLSKGLLFELVAERQFTIDDVEDWIDQYRELLYVDGDTITLIE